MIALIGLTNDLKDTGLNWYGPWRIGYIDGDDLYIDDKYLDRCSVKEIIKSGKGS